MRRRASTPGRHERHARIAVYPAEEVTLDDGSHVIAYGISERIRPRMGLGETLDAIRAQGGVSSAPHPFSILDALRERAAECDIVEVFNSNNADVISTRAPRRLRTSGPWWRRRERLARGLDDRQVRQRH